MVKGPVHCNSPSLKPLMVVCNTSKCRKQMTNCISSPSFFLCPNHPHKMFRLTKCAYHCREGDPLWNHPRKFHPMAKSVFLSHPFSFRPMTHINCPISPNVFTFAMTNFPFQITYIDISICMYLNGTSERKVKKGNI